MSRGTLYCLPYRHCLAGFSSPIAVSWMFTMTLLTRVAETESLSSSSKFHAGRTAGGQKGGCIIGCPRVTKTSPRSEIKENQSPTASIHQVISSTRYLVGGERDYLNFSIELSKSFFAEASLRDGLIDFLLHCEHKRNSLLGLEISESKEGSKQRRSVSE
ncbi:unnamed protein product [Dovyalis caffra]|uniref:Uncharacterized protein n=1 Tax=Dovyalis caffra TaxID=77055 RepID=A0AAV1SQ15_9ROSI|nr:unnamed protein product [Dovyalis caffra]